MAIQRNKEDDRLPSADPEIPAPVGDGYDFVQSLGRVIDDLMGHSRDGEKVGAFRSEDRPGDPEGDPEPVTPPEPVPQGDDIGTRGADPETFETK